MAKVPFSKLALKKQEEVKKININNIEIEVKQYLPILDKLVLIGNVINEASDDNNFSNPVKNELFGSLEIIMFYTNLTFTDKQREDPCKLYDLLETNGVIEAIMSAIPEEEYNFVIDGIDTCADAVYRYKNSTLGFLESLSDDYNNMDLEATEIQKKLADAENLDLLKSILTKIG